MSLKQASIEKVTKALDNKYFTSSDFKLDYSLTSASLINVTFKHNEEFSFSITEETIYSQIPIESDKTVLFTNESPGNFKTHERNQCSDFDSCISRLEKWCENVHKELVANVPLFRGVEELKMKLEEHIQFHFDEPNEKFTASEILNIKEKFDELYQKFADLKEKHEITEEQLNEIKSEIDIVKRNSQQYQKGVWGGVAKSRILKIVSKVFASEAAQKLLYDAGTKLL